jgi:hypothetical protein
MEDQVTVEIIAYEEARHALDVQKQALNELRARAGTLLAAAALVTSFFGGQALEGGAAIDGAAQTAVYAFIGLAVLAILVLLPWPFNWSLNPCSLVTDYVDAKPKSKSKVMLRDLALHHDKSREMNECKISALNWAFRLCAVLLAVEVVAWLHAM